MDIKVVLVEQKNYSLARIETLIIMLGMVS